MKSIKEMLDEVLDLDVTGNNETWFCVDEDSSIFVEICEDKEFNKVQVFVEWRNVDTYETYDSTCCDYDKVSIENALVYIRGSALQALLPAFEFYADEQIDSLQSYIEEKCKLDFISKQLLHNILTYVSAHGDDNENIFYMLSELLDGVVEEEQLIEGLKVL